MIERYATKDYVIAQNIELKRGLIDLQLQQNTARRENLRGQLYTIEAEIAKGAASVKSMQQRDSVKDDLEDAVKERQRLQDQRK